MPFERNSPGFSLVELLIVTSLLLVIMASVFTALSPAQDTFQTEPEMADVQQRARVGIDTLSRELMQAGAGSYQGLHSGPLYGFFPSVLPFRQGQRNADPPGTFRSDTITIVRVNSGAAQTTIAQDMAAQSSTIQVNIDDGCPVGDPLCAFRAGTTAIVFDDSGAYDLFNVVGILGSALILQHNLRDFTQVYRAGEARIVGATARTFYLKADAVAETYQLMQYDGASGADVPVVDHVVGLSFEYFGDPQPPLMRKPIMKPTGPWTTYGPKPPPAGVQTTLYPAGENCVFISAGLLAPLPRLEVLGAGGPALVRLDASQLTDGPWCPDAANPNRFDADLLRIRSVAVSLRVESAIAAFRGPAGPLFTRGGTSTGKHFVPDYELRVEISPPNLNFGR